MLESARTVIKRDQPICCGAAVMDRDFDVESGWITELGKARSDEYMERILAFVQEIEKSSPYSVGGQRFSSSTGAITANAVSNSTLVANNPANFVSTRTRPHGSSSQYAGMLSTAVSRSLILVKLHVHRGVNGGSDSFGMMVFVRSRGGLLGL